MAALLVFTVAIFGIAFCVGFAKVSYPVRSLFDPESWVLVFVECPACTSWWLGLCAVLTGIAPSVFGVGLLGALTCAFYCCASSLVLAKLSGLTEE